jgi:hypothetical protein
MSPFSAPFSGAPKATASASKASSCFIGGPNGVRAEPGIRWADHSGCHAGAQWDVSIA